MTYKEAEKHLHYLYLLFAIPLCFITALLTPPYQNPDEPNHFMRAEQLSRLEIIPAFVPQKPGITDTISKDPRIVYPAPGGFGADKGITASYTYLKPIFFHPEVKVDRDKLDSAKKVKWGSGIGYFNFANTTIYSPVGYVMPAFGIVIGKILGLPIISTLYICRFLNILLSVTLCFFALTFAKKSKLLMFIVLLFPMCIALFASVSQDAIIISAAFLLVAIIDNVEFTDDKKYLTKHLVMMAILMAIVSVAKPPYSLLAFVFLFLSINVKQKAFILGLPFIVTLTWLFLSRQNLTVTFAPGWLHFNPKLQLAHIIQNPSRFIGMFFKFDFNAITRNLKMFVGVLGWLDLTFPQIYYNAAFCLLILGFVISATRVPVEHKVVRGALLFSVLTTIIALLAVQYITWTPLDAPDFNGMAGRYLIPVFPFLALSLSNGTWAETGKKQVLAFIPLVFPIISAVFLIAGLIQRYY